MKYRYNGQLNKKKTERRNRFNERERSLSFPLIILLILLGSILSGSASADKNGTILIAIYASGGTLEKDSGLVTSDFIQIVQGTENYSSDNVTVIAAYGGSDKRGWYGMTIADLDDLRQDLSDGDLGNENTFQIHLPQASMGDPNTLGFFLSYIKQHYHFERVFLIFIGHGQAYTGMLFDQNHEDDGLSIGELTESLTQGPEVELIGFDSCLMGCLELVSALSTHATYCIASEESEPSEGWPYKSWIEFLVHNPGITTEEYAQNLFREYMKTPGQGKTIALVYLKDAGFLTLKLDRFAKELYALAGAEDGYAILNTALAETQHFGLTGTGELDKATMDLYDFADIVRRNVPYLAESAEGVIEGVNRTVIIAKHDERVQGAHGIAVLSPLPINPVFYEYYRESASITPSWDRFISRYLDICPKEGDILPDTSSDKESGQSNR